MRYRSGEMNYVYGYIYIYKYQCMFVFVTQKHVLLLLFWCNLWTCFVILIIVRFV